MNTKYKIFIIGGAVGLAVLLIGAGLFFRASQKGKQVNQEIVNQEVSTDEPVDIVMDFYLSWLQATKSTSTNPYQSGLASSSILSSALSARLKGTEGHAVTELDPVLCQTTVPEKITGRVVFKLEDKAQILIMAKDKALTEQAIVTLKRLNDGWYIDEIVCSPGEFAPAREFSFEKEGYLLKNVPPPLDPKNWYIVFEENKELGHYAPLFFDGESKCLSTDKNETVCSPNQFVEAKKVHIYGQMTELGVEVKRLEFIE